MPMSSGGAMATGVLPCALNNFRLDIHEENDARDSPSFSTVGIGVEIMTMGIVYIGVEIMSMSI